MSHLRIATTAAGHKTTIEVDGHNVSNMCRGYVLRGSVGEFTTLELDLAVLKPADVEGEARIVLSPEVEQALTSLGWTPPES